MPSISLIQMRIAARKRLLRIGKAAMRSFYFAFDVIYYLKRGDTLQRAIELARNTIY